MVRSDTMMNVCALCSRELSADLAAGAADRPISHGICLDCLESLSNDYRPTLREFLDGLGDPVFVVDGDAKFIAANRAAQSVVGREPSEIEGHPFGSIIACANSILPGGCGSTEHCVACTIRQSVTTAVTQGKSRRRVPAYHDILTKDGISRRRFVISTERLGGSVLLRVDAVDRKNCE